MKLEILRFEGIAFRIVLALGFREKGVEKFAEKIYDLLGAVALYNISV